MTIMSMNKAHLPPPDPMAILCDQRRLGVYTLVFGLQGTEHERSLFSGHEEGLIIEWSLSSNRPEHSWIGHSGTVLWIGMESIAGTAFLCTQGREGLVKVWSYSCGLWTSQVDIHCASMIFCNSALTVANDVFMLAVPGEPQSTVDLQKLSYTNQKSTKLQVSSHLSLQPHEVKECGMCMKIMFLPNINNCLQLLVGHEGGIIVLWDLTQSKQLNHLRLFNDPVMCLTSWTSTLNGNQVIKGCCGSTSNDLKSFYILDNIIFNEKSLSVTNAGFSDACCRKDDKIFVTGGWDHAGRVFSAKSLKPLVVLTYHQQNIGAVIFSHNNTLAMGCRGGYITLWNVYQNK